MIVKQCRCGRSYTLAEWQQLRLVGMQEDGEGGFLELRECTCRSTLSVEAQKE